MMHRNLQFQQGFYNYFWKYDKILIQACEINSITDHEFTYKLQHFIYTDFQSSCIQHQHYERKHLWLTKQEDLLENSFNEQLKSKDDLRLLK